MEHINPTLVCFLVNVTSPGFSSLSPSLQSPNMLTDSSSQIIPPSPIPNDATQEMVESSGGSHATMMITNNNLPHQPMDIDLSPQGCKKGTADIPTEESVDITSHESNADPISAPLLPSFDSEVVSEKDAMNLISLKSGKKGTADIPTEESVDITSHESNADPISAPLLPSFDSEVTKHVERSVDNVNLVVAMYDGIHEHVPPPERISKSSMPPYSSSASQLFPSALAPQLNVTSLQVDKNHGVMNRNDEPNIDPVIPDGTEVSEGIRERLFRNFGIEL
ncbi:hypothetical protein YC2023_093590 [Brassica napus]